MPFKMKGFPAMKGTGAMKAMKESAMKKMHASPKKAMKDPMKKMKDPMKKMKDPMKAMHASPKKAMSPKKKMTDSKEAKIKRKILSKKEMEGKRKEFFEKNTYNPSAPGNIYDKMKAKKNSPKKAMSPKKKTIAKDKDPKFKKSNRRSQAEFEPMYEGADISRAQFNKMSKREQKKYVKTQTN